MRDRKVKPGMRVMAFGLESGLPILCAVISRDLYDHAPIREWWLKRPDGVTISRFAREFQEVSE